MISILSLGSTRGVWKGAADEDYRRLTGYAQHLARYVVVSSSYKKHQLKPLLLENGIEAVPTDAFSPLDAFFRMLWIGGGFLRQGGFDLIQGQDPFFTGLAACFLGRWFSLPVNVCVYGPNVFDPLWRNTSWTHWFLSWIGMFVLRRVDGIQVDGIQTQMCLIRKGFPAERIFLKPVVPDNLAEFFRTRKVPGKTDAVRLLAVGRLVAQKDFGGLLEAFRILVRDRRVNARLQIIGDGVEKAELVRKARRDGTLDRVDWIGAVSREEMPGCMACADVFVLSSRYEGFARVLMEAAAAGVACVSTEVSGSEELLGGIGERVQGILSASGVEAGFPAVHGPRVLKWPRVPVGDPWALADQLEQLCTYSAARKVLGRLLRRRVSSWLDPVSSQIQQVAIWKTLVARYRKTHGLHVFTIGNRDGAAGPPEIIAIPSKRDRFLEKNGAELLKQRGAEDSLQTGLMSDLAGSPIPPLGRVLVFNLATDSEHPVLGFTTLWLRELARWANQVDVVTMWGGRLDLPKNVRVFSVGRELGLSRIQRAIRFIRMLERVFREGDIDGCFSHMNIEFSVLGAPQLWLRKVPLVTWYAHPSLNQTLRMANWVSDRIVTSFPNSYPISDKKVRIIGQGIDTQLFSPGVPELEVSGRILCVGRVSPSKDLLTLIQAASELAGDWHLRILGACVCDADVQYRKELELEVERLGIRDQVEFVEPVPARELPEHFRRCAVHVNLTPAGFGDKVALEAMSCGRPCLFANADFFKMLGDAGRPFYFEPGSVAGLRELLGLVLGWSQARRRQESEPLRQWVESNHSLAGLARRIVGELVELREVNRG